jgi:hypothetical protein
MTNILRQGYCGKDTAEKILQRRYCNEGTAAKMLHRKYCRGDTAEMTPWQSYFSEKVQTQVDFFRNLSIFYKIQLIDSIL